MELSQFLDRLEEVMRMVIVMGLLCIAGVLQAEVGRVAPTSLDELLVDLVFCFIVINVTVIVHGPRLELLQGFVSCCVSFLQMYGGESCTTKSYRNDATRERVDN